MATTHPTATAPVCVVPARSLVARVAGGRAAATVGTGGNAEPECRLFAGRLRVVVNVDSSPQPYARMERLIVEDGQQFGVVRGFAPPASVPRLGLDAAWLPDYSQLVTTDGRRLITVTVKWRGAGARRRLGLAKAVARLYLGPLVKGAAAHTEA